MKILDTLARLVRWLCRKLICARIGHQSHEVVVGGRALASLSTVEVCDRCGNEGATRTYWANRAAGRWTR